MNKFEVFGTRSVSEVAAAISSNISHRYGAGRPAEDIEDAVSVGVLAVLDYWIPKYGSKYEDKAMAFTYAVTFGRSRASEAMLRTLDRSLIEGPLAEGVLTEKGGDVLYLEDVIPDLGPGPEDQYVLQESNRFVSAAWRHANTAEWSNCYGPWFSGESTRQQASREATSQTSIVQRRALGRSRLQSFLVGVLSD